MAVEAPREPVEDDVDQETGKVLSAVPETGEPVLEPDQETVEEPLPVEDPEPSPRLTYRPSWQPAWSAEEYERRFPKRSPEQTEAEQHASITDRLEAARKLVEGHARGAAPVDDKRGQRIEQPDVHEPMNDRCSRMAEEVRARPNDTKRRNSQ